MRCFDPTGAKHFCRPPQPSGPRTMRKLGIGVTKVARSVAEGSADFEAIRSACISDVDRALFLAASNYWRGCELLRVGSAHWAHVTLYYCSLYAAKALTGMFGVWIDEPFVVMEATVSLPGRQEVLVSDRRPPAGGGSHVQFWDGFYAAGVHLAPWVQPSEQWVLGPVGGDKRTLCAARNAVNYEMDIAIESSVVLGKSFTVGNFPKCLSGGLRTQFNVSEQLTRLAFRFAGDFSLSTAALGGIGTGATRWRKVRDYIVLSKKPRLDKRLLRSELLT